MKWPAWSALAGAVALAAVFTGSIALLQRFGPKSPTGLAVGDAPADSPIQFLSPTDPFPGVMTAVSFPARTVGYAMGATSVAKTTDGRTFRTLSHPALLEQPEFRDMDFASETVGVVVGGAGLVLRTGDGGQTWSRIQSGVTADLDAVDFSSAQIGYAAGGQGTLLKTQDGGRTWSPRTSETNGRIVSVDFSDDAMGAAAVLGPPGSVIFTSDGGASWTARAVPSGDRVDQVDIVSPTVAYAIARSSADPRRNRLLKTTDQGVNWTVSLTPPRGFPDHLTAVRFLDAQRGVASSCFGDAVIDLSVHVTSNGGATWTETRVAFPPGRGDPEINDIAFQDATSVVGVGLGAVFTSDLATWTVSPQGPVVLEGSVVEVAFLAESTLLAAQANIETTAEGAAFRRGGRLSRSTDGGATWSVVQDIGSAVLDLEAVSASVAFCTNVTTSGSSPGTVVRRTQDGGTTWTTVFLAPPVGSGVVQDGLVRFGDTQTGWLVTHGNFANARVFRTLDGGNTWLPAGGIDTTNGLRRFDVAPVGQGQFELLALGTFGDLFRSSDGISWTRVTTPQGATFGDVLVLDRNRYVASEFTGGLFRTLNAGGSWEALTIRSQIEGRPGTFKANRFERALGDGRLLAAGLMEYDQALRQASGIESRGCVLLLEEAGARVVRELTPGAAVSFDETSRAFRGSRRQTVSLPGRALAGTNTVPTFLTRRDSAISSAVDGFFARVIAGDAGAGGGAPPPGGGGGTPPPSGGGGGTPPPSGGGGGTPPPDGGGGGTPPPGGGGGTGVRASDEITVGLGEFPEDGGLFETFRGSNEGFLPLARTRLRFGAYNAANGETRPVLGDVDGDGLDEVVVGMGSFPQRGGFVFVLDDHDHGYAQLKVLRLRHSAYNSSDGQTWPAVGDLDGDGAAEVVVGMGSFPEAGGFIHVFDDPLAATPPQRIYRVPFRPYNQENGETRPACGDLDGDGDDEVVVGLGEFPRSGGFLWALLEPMVPRGPRSQFLRLHATAYNRANGETFPACGDLDGDGKDEIVVGIGAFPERGGFVEAMGGPGSSFGIRHFVQLDEPDYVADNGETRPSCGDVDGDGKDELLIGIGLFEGEGGFVDLFDDFTSNFAPLRRIEGSDSAYIDANGSTRPAAGNLTN